jgi:hypothetical protein
MTARRFFPLLITAMLFSGSAFAADPVPGDACANINRWQWAGANPDGGYFNGMFCNGSTYAGVINFQSTGNVGIGTTSPAAKLDVAGEIRTTGNTLACASGTAGAIRYNSSSKAFDYCGGATPAWTAFGGSSAAGSSGQVQFNSGGALAGASGLYYASSTGNVGIGTTGPVSTLSVNGGLAVGSTYAGSNNAGTNNLIVQGIVGIGTTSPSSTLAVAGGVAIGGTYAGSNAAAANNLIVQGATGIGTASPAATLDVVGEIRTTGNTLACASGTAGAIRYNSSSKAFDYCGGATPAWTAFSSGATPAGSSGQVQFNSGGALAGASGLVYTSSGNVGIGTASPTAALMVASGSSFMKVIPAWLSGAGTWIDMDTAGPSGIGSGGAGSNPWMAYVASADNFLNGSTIGDVVYRNASGHRILMGIDNGAGNAYPQLTMSSSVFEISSTPQVNIDAAGVVGGRLAITTGGNVGIKNASPAALLDIGTAGTTLGTMRLEGSTSGYVQLQPAAAAGSWTMTLPAAAGTNGYFLKTDGAGVTSWATTTATPAGSDKQIQLNNNGVLYASSGLTYNSTTGALTNTGSESVTNTALNGIAISGTASSGNGEGVYGTTSSTTNAASGLYGHATGGAGINYGIYGDNSSAAGYGIYGLNSGSAGTGVQGVANAGAGIGLAGSTTSTTAAASGVQGVASGASGATYGVYASDGSATGYGVYSSATQNYFSGKVGIGAASPAATLDVAGEIRTTGNTLACAGTTAGAVRYNSSTTKMDYCNGTSWGGIKAFAGALIYQTATQVLANDNTDYLANLGSKSYDTSGFWSAGNANRLTVPAGVSYARVCASWSYTTYGSYDYAGFIYKNGNGNFAGSAGTEGTAAGNGSACTSPLPVVAGDYFQLDVYADGTPNTTNRTVASGSDSTWLSIEVLQ